MLNLVLFGPPGSGKGTQSIRLAKKYNLIHLSTGDMLRSEIAKKSELGLAAQAIMNRGELVSDKIVIGMIEKQIENNPQARGFIFDGFPRTTVQAMALDELLDKHDTGITVTLSLEVDNDELVKRLLLRGKDSGRADDQNEGVIANRIREYQVKTSPLIEYYKQEGKYRSVWGMGEIDEVFDLLCHEIDHAEAGDAHGEGVLQEADIPGSQRVSHDKKNKNKKHHKNQNLMLHEENNDQNNHGPNNNGNHDNDHGNDQDNNHDEQHDEQDETQDDADDQEMEGSAEESRDDNRDKEEAPAPKPVKKAAPAKKKAAKPAKKAAKPVKKAAKKSAKKASKPAKKASKPAKKGGKKAAPKKAAKKGGKKSAPKKAAKKGGKKAAPKKAAKKGGAKAAKKGGKKAAPKKGGAKGKSKGKKRR